MTGKIISILSAKGGSGQSFVASNLAVALNRESGKPVALVDLTFTGASDIENLLNVTETKSVFDLLPVIEHLDAELIKGYLTEYQPGIHYLKGISSSGQFSGIRPEHVLKVISVLSEAYSYVVIDTARGLSTLAMAILDSANLVLLLMTPDIMSFNRTKNKLDRLTEMHYPLSVIKLVVNMHGIYDALPKEKIESFLKHEVFAEIHHDPAAVISSINKGTLPVIKNQRTNFSKSILQLADLLVSQEDLYVVRDKKPFGDWAAKRAAETEIPALDDPRTNHSAEIRAENAGPRETEGGRPYAPSEARTGGINGLTALKNRLHEKLLDEMDLKSLNLQAPGKQEETKNKTRQTIERLVAQENIPELNDRDARTGFINELLDEVLGLGPLEPFLRDPSVSEIMTIGRDKIYIEQSGKIRLTGARFSDDAQLLAIIERIVSPIGRRVDESSPLCDARLADGSRVNIIIPPLALDGPAITIRKFSEKSLSVDDLIKHGSLTPDIGQFLKLCVTLRKNIVVSGGTGSGKTTLLNILSSYIPEGERIVTVEDSAELKLQQGHVVRLESRPANIEGRGAIPIRNLVINALRMRPDRIVVGECRGGETLDMLQAMNTGHDGSITTIHANSTRDALSRMETMVLLGNTELPVKAIREQIKSAIDLIVQAARLSDGTRKITAVTEITGMEGEVITTQDIFRFNQTGVSEEGKVLGGFAPTGLVPTFMEDIGTKGAEFDIGIFRGKK
jgi:pilus assembly protein CpaF